LKTKEYADLSNEKMLFLYNKLTGMAPYTHEFVQGHLDSQMLSGFIAAMSSFMEEMTGSEQLQWKTVYGRDTSLLVEASDWMVGVLAVVRETQEYRSKLRRIVREYEQAFESLKDADGIEGGVFSEFDKYVQRLFVEDRLTEGTIILKGSDCLQVYKEKGDKKENVALCSLLTEVSDGQTISEFADETDTSLPVLREVLSEAFWKNLLHLHYMPTEEDILVMSSGSSSALFSAENPFGLSQLALRVVGTLDGRKRLARFLTGMSEAKKESILIELGNLCNLGVLSNIPIEQKFVLLSECIVTRLYHELSSELGEKSTHELFEEAKGNAIKRNSWAARITMEYEERVAIDFETTVTPRDLDRIAEALELYSVEIIELHAKTVGTTQAKEILKECTDACSSEWRASIEDILL
jgi:hypothetical protein